VRSRTQRLRSGSSPPGTSTGTRHVLLANIGALDALSRFLPKTANLLAALPPFGSRRFGAQLQATFPRCENISIDYAVLERASNVVGLAAGDIGWNDVGSWNAVYELEKRDVHGNSSRAKLSSSRAPATTSMRKRSWCPIRREGPDCSGYPRRPLDRRPQPRQEVGELVKRLEKSGREDLCNPAFVAHASARTTRGEPSSRASTRVSMLGRRQERLPYTACAESCEKSTNPNRVPLPTTRLSPFSELCSKS